MSLPFSDPAMLSAVTAINRQIIRLAPVGSWQQVSLAYTATAADAGKKIGIKMYGDKYVTFEDVTLFHSSEPPADPRVNLYEDKKIDFKDFAELAVWWLDEQLWP